MAEHLLRPEDVAREWLKLSRARIYELIATGQLRSVMIGRSRRIPESAIRELIDRLNVDQASQGHGR